MNYLQLTEQLQPADVVVAKKRKGLGRILNHYIVYEGNGKFIANLEDGVKEINPAELIHLLKEYEPVKIRKFKGSLIERNNAIQIAHNNIGRPYSLTSFNCEHFANLVQKGIKSSAQVTIGFLSIIAITGLIYKTKYNGKGR